MTPFSAFSSDGLMMIALTPAEISVREIRDLLGWPRFAIGQDDLGHEARSERFGLDRADEFLTPAIADMGVGDPDHELLRGAGAAGCSCSQPREQSKHGDFAKASHILLPRVACYG